MGKCLEWKRKLKEKEILLLLLLDEENSRIIKQKIKEKLIEENLI
jgi:hypothetical protein